MHRTIISIAALIAPAAGAAGTPEIAYAVGGTRGDSVYVSDSDATGISKLYEGKFTSRFGNPIKSIAIRSRAGGGEVAFLEGNFDIKIVKFDDNRRPVGQPYLVTVAGEPNCGRHNLDYLQDGTLLVATCSKLWAVPPDATAASDTPYMSNVFVQALTARDASVLYVADEQLRDSGSTTPIAMVTFPLNFIDASASTAYLSDMKSFQTISLSAPHAVTPGCTSAGMVEVSPDGSHILYLFRGWAFVQSANCSGMPFRLVKGVRSMAWRTY